MCLFKYLFYSVLLPCTCFFLSLSKPTALGIPQAERLIAVKGATCVEIAQPGRGCDGSCSQDSLCLTSSYCQALDKGAKVISK